ncbi:trypsin-like peptidase domain-containing protein [Mycolicibacterium hodleri]
MMPRLTRKAVLVVIGTTMLVVAAVDVSACGRLAPAALPSTASVAAVPTVVAPATASAEPQAIAHPSDPDPRVGAIFVGDSPTPTCTGSVLHSDSGDLILTAAHCLQDGVDTTFVPGFSGDAGLDDAWGVQAVYLDPRWVNVQDPHADYAVARVGSKASASIESQVGDGLLLSPRPAEASVVAVTGYGLGDDSPIHCQAGTRPAPGGFLSLPCEGLVAGTSGAPWVSGRSTVVGLTGGPHGGGCADDVSYSPPFDDQLTALFKRAEEGGPSDEAPVPLPDGCPVAP